MKKPLIFSIIIIFTTLIFNVSCKKDPTSSNGPMTVTDIDGNVYQTVQIGNQIWMAENLKVTNFKNGSPITNAIENSEWDSGYPLSAHCSYKNDDTNVQKYGMLYNWYAVNDSRDIAPEGWHIPTDEEWIQLEMFLGMDQAEAYSEGNRGTNEGGKLKSTTGWDNNSYATNESGFSALPGGYRYGEADDDYTSNEATFEELGKEGKFWTSTEESQGYAYARSLNYMEYDIRRYSPIKESGRSIRCIKD